MKWPERLTLIRHAESSFNMSKVLKAADPLYAEFLASFSEDYQSERSKMLARQIWDKYKRGVGDQDTPLSENARHQAFETGKNLKEIEKLPDVVFLSPYDRTCQTFEIMCEAWPELKKVKTVLEDRLIEQDHGLADMYSDWRVFFVFHPEQKMLRDIRGEYWYRYPQGENLPDVRERIRSWLTTIVRDYNEKNVLTVTHHLTILSIRANLERLGAEEFHRLDTEEKPINCGVTIYKGIPDKGKDGKLELESYNTKLY